MLSYLNPRQSERTTATEIETVRQEINEQLAGIYGKFNCFLIENHT